MSLIPPASPADQRAAEEHFLSLRAARENQLALIALAAGHAAALRRHAPAPPAPKTEPAESRPAMTEQIRRLGLWRLVEEAPPAVVAPAGPATAAARPTCERRAAKMAKPA